jgi:hypothetical protein
MHASPPPPPPPVVHRAAFRDRAAMVLIELGNGAWAAFNPRTASFDAIWRGEVDWRGKVYDFSQETSRPKGEILRDRTQPLATIPDATIEPGQTIAMRCGGRGTGEAANAADAADSPTTARPQWHSLLLAFDEQGRTPVVVRAVERDGAERARFESCTHVSSDTEWQWNFKSLRGPALPMAVEWTNPGTTPKPVRNLRIEGEEIAWTDAEGRALTVTWRGYDRAPDAITLRFDLAAPGAAPVPVTQRVRADGRGLRIETAGLPADSGWKTTLSDDPSIVTIGADR